MHSQLKFFLVFLLFTALFTVLFFSMLDQSVDALYLNGNVYTVDAKNSRVEAFAIKEGKIVATGSTTAMRGRFTAGNIVDLEGKTVVPGFIDSHAHFLSLGFARLTLDLSGVASTAEIAERVRRQALRSQPGQWIRGRGWDQNLWPTKSFPTHRILDGVAPEHPVYLERVDGHAIWVNARAMEIAGVTRETKDPEGGRIVRDERGHPTGIFIDEAIQFVARHLPPPTESEVDEALRIASQECLSYGITTVHDMGVGLSELSHYIRAIDAGRFPLRVYAAIDGPGETWEHYLQRGPLIQYGDRLTVRAIKVYLDGALGSRGAALIEPYSDDPTNRGLTLISEEELQRIVEQALDHKFQVCTHAIGDRANNIVLNVYERATRKKNVRDHRLRVEHAQVLFPGDIPRFRQIGVLPSMQPTHCTSDMYWAEARLGPTRVRGAYAWASLLFTGTIIPSGSDFPVENPNPLWGIYAAITRQDHRGLPRTAEDVRKYFQVSKEGIVDPTAFEGGWYVGERMTREQALRSFTIWGAYAAFQEHLVGSLEAGKWADFVILSHDIMNVAPPELLTTRVERTYIAGVEVYRNLLSLSERFQH
jgi:predicted amidohydrolase YtcJ